MPHSATAAEDIRLLPAWTGREGTAQSGGAGPWAGFTLAAEAAVRDLYARFGWDLWAVDRVDGDRLVAVAAAGSWATAGPVGATARGDDAVLVPLLSGDGEPIGWLRGWSSRPTSTVEEARDAAVLLGRMLATIAAGERAAADRSAEAAAAYALATRDGLTGLLNRRGWQNALEAEEQRARRYGRAVSALVIDLDALKQLNDSSGHQAGDAALAVCAEVLAAVCRPGDAVARIGGDEFAVLAVECDVVSARALTIRLREAMRTAGVRASVGAATRRPGEELASTVQRADQAMYRLKRRGTPAASPAPLGRPTRYGATVRARAELLPA